MDIHGVERDHVVELIARRRFVENNGEASCIDVVHFNERYSNSWDGDPLVKQSPFYVLPDFQSRNVIGSSRLGDFSERSHRTMISVKSRGSIDHPAMIS